MRQILRQVTPLTTTHTPRTRAEPPESVGGRRPAKAPLPERALAAADDTRRGGFIPSGPGPPGCDRAPARRGMLGGDAAPSLVVSQSVVTGRASRACDWPSLMASNSWSALSMVPGGGGAGHGLHEYVVHLWPYDSVLVPVVTGRRPHHGFDDAVTGRRREGAAAGAFRRNGKPEWCGPFATPGERGPGS